MVLLVQLQFILGSGFCVVKANWERSSAGAVQAPLESEWPMAWPAAAIFNTFKLFCLNSSALGSSQKSRHYLGFLFLCAFFVPSHIFKNDSATAIPPSLPFCCSPANCVVLIVPAAVTSKWLGVTSWLWAKQWELTICKLIQGNRKNSLLNMNFHLAASFLSIQKYSFILIALKTKQLFFSIFTSKPNYIVSTRQPCVAEVY